ncbi:MAG: hypothetical protein JW791_02770 [Nanoarchaeota archaeon]|nr:hypothetical protein [Nanoarchaeota archaeon]
MKEIEVGSLESKARVDFNSLSEVERALYLTECFENTEYQSSKDFVRHFVQKDNSIDFKGMAAYLRTRKD